MTGIFYIAALLVAGYGGAANLSHYFIALSALLFFIGYVFERMPFIQSGQIPFSLSFVISTIGIYLIPSAIVYFLFLYIFHG